MSHTHKSRTSFRPSVIGPHSGPYGKAVTGRVYCKGPVAGPDPSLRIGFSEHNT